MSLDEARRRHVGAATVTCRNGHLIGIFVEDPTEMDFCVATCVFRHELLHVDQFNFYCPDFCKDPCNEGRVPGWPNFPWPREQARPVFECAAYRLEISCLRSHLADRLCNPVRIRQRIQQLEDAMRDDLRCHIRRIPPPEVELPEMPVELPPMTGPGEIAKPPIKRLPPVEGEKPPLRRLPPVDDHQ